MADEASVGEASLARAEPQPPLPPETLSPKDTLVPRAELPALATKLGVAHVVEEQPKIKHERHSTTIYKTARHTYVRWSTLKTTTQYITITERTTWQHKH